MRKKEVGKAAEHACGTLHKILVLTLGILVVKLVLSLSVREQQVASERLVYLASRSTKLNRKRWSVAKGEYTAE